MCKLNPHQSLTISRYSATQRCASSMMAFYVWGVIACLWASLSGCSTTQDRPNAQDVFEQAMVKTQSRSHADPLSKLHAAAPDITLLDIKPRAAVLMWQFTQKETRLSDQQRRELLALCLSVADFGDKKLLIQLGPDWLSSHLRGQSIRAQVPRALLIQQEYVPTFPAHQVRLSIQENAVAYIQDEHNAFRARSTP